MLTNLLSAAKVKSPEMTTPPAIIAPRMMAILRISAKVASSGTASLSPYTARAKSPAAAIPAITPCVKLLPRKGRMMNHLVAPTSFMVLMMYRFEKMASRMVFPRRMSEMTSSAPPKRMSTRRILFTVAWRRSATCAG